MRLPDPTLRREPDPLVEAFASARARPGGARLEAYLPEIDHPRALPILRDLVRIDLEYGWREGHPPSLDSYRASCPHLFEDSTVLAEIAFTEYRLRLLHEDPEARPEEYESRYGVATTNWPRLSEGRSPFPPTRTAQAGVPVDHFQDDSANISWESKLDAGLRETVPHPLFPTVGTTFLDFRIVAELGRGAFGRVFLAQQGELAGRLVALKLSTEPLNESETLAGLLHTNIVPVYSIHRHGHLHALCMPFLGATTLAHILQDLRGGEHPHSGLELLTTQRNRVATVSESKPDSAGYPSPAERPGIPAPQPGTTTILDMLSRLSYVDAVLWLGSRLADGLAHAHDRGILHRDIKPANVLLTDEGQPMFLDFNLAQSAHSEARGRAGGTVAYMAPEQLAGFATGMPSGDARSDLYSLGLLLYELLTRQYPFRRLEDPIHQSLPILLAERRCQPPSPRQVNRTLAPGVDAIVRHCLHPDPKHRYQSARELFEDLERQRTHLPLRHAPNPSWRERGTKWVRRHPRLTSGAALATLGSVLLFLLLGAFLYRGYQLEKAQALLALDQFEEAHRQAQMDLTTRNAHPDQLRQGMAVAQQALDHFRILEQGDWTENRPYRTLDPVRQQRLQIAVGELLLLLARAGQMRSTTMPEPGRTEELNRALSYVHRAEPCFGRTPRALWRIQAGLLAGLGREEEARALQEQAKGKPRASVDRFLLGSEHAATGNYLRAIPLLEEATHLDPRHHAAWFILGFCNHELTNFVEAVRCFTTAIALRPEHAPSHLNRGLAHSRRGEHHLAELDFSEAIRLAPEHAEAWGNRGICRLALNQPGEAQEDLTTALEMGSKHLRLYFLRARARIQLRDPEGARADQQRGMSLPPCDDSDHVTRGMARLTRDPSGAFLDFDAALRFNPWSQEAMSNKAYVLAEKRRDLGWAISELDVALRRYPDSVRLRGGRAIYRARLGWRVKAHEDARECLRRDASSFILYQMAGVHALTSRLVPADRQEALRLFARALERGFDRFDLIVKDPDIEEIRSASEYHQLLNAARALKRSSKKAQGSKSSRDTR